GPLHEALARDGYRTLLEREVLPAWLARRRWFARRSDEDAPPVRIRHVAPLADELALLVLEAGDEPAPDIYFVPLGIAWEHPELPPLPQQLALARVRRVHRVGFLTDAFALPALGAAMLAGWRSKAALPVAGGALRFEAMPL